MEDVVVIGAGLSGLTAAQVLHRLGYRVLVIDKSRGLGGRLATRRLGTTVLDHGCRYLQPFTDPALSPIPGLLTANVLQPWQPESFELKSDGSLAATPASTLYVAPQGMSAVAKALASELTVVRHWLATALTPIPKGWRIEGKFLGDDDQRHPRTLIARGVVVAIPAPQAVALMDAAAQNREGVEDLSRQLQGVDFEAVITVMAGYDLNQATRLPSQAGSGGWMIHSDTHPTLRWAALDSSKRTDPKESVVVFHSSPGFAAEALELADLEPVGHRLLKAAAGLGAWIPFTKWTQVHRWRYGFVRQALGTPILSSPKLLNLVGCGDWCSGGNAEGAIASGRQAAAAIATALG